jgi:hypothetical protein
VSKPDTDIAAVTEDGPGTGTTLTFCSRADFTKKCPGSDMSGVPASDINDTILPSRISLKISSTFLISLNL